MLPSAAGYSSQSSKCSAITIDQHDPQHARRRQREPPAALDLVQQRADHRRDQRERRDRDQQVERDLGLGLGARRREEQRVRQRHGHRGVGGVVQHHRVGERGHAGLLGAVGVGRAPERRDRRCEICLLRNQATRVTVSFFGGFGVGVVCCSSFGSGRVFWGFSRRGGGWKPCSDAGPRNAPAAGTRRPATGSASESARHSTRGRPSHPQSCPIPLNLTRKMVGQFLPVTRNSLVPGTCAMPLSTSAFGSDGLSDDRS